MSKLQAYIFCVTLLISISGHTIDDKIVAIVNDNVILQSQLDDKLSNFDRRQMSRLELAKLKNDVLEKLIEESLILQAASRLGIKITDIDVQNRIRLIAEGQKLTVLQLKQEIERQNINYLDYIRNIKNQIMIQELFRTQFTNRAYVSDEEIQSYLKRNNISSGEDNQVDIEEYMIKSENNSIDPGKANLVLNSIKQNGYDETTNKYPKIKIEKTSLNDASYSKLPEIYINNLKILDEKGFSKIFSTGRGYTLLTLTSNNMTITEYKVSHILLTTNPMEDRKRIMNRLIEIKKNTNTIEDFSEHARKVSLDRASAINGGSLGWISQDAVVKEFKSVMVVTNINTVSEPFKTKFGWHILYLEDKRVKDISDDVMKRRAMNILKERKVVVAREEWLAKLKDQAYIEKLE